jgi:hypothetical protein
VKTKSIVVRTQQAESRLIQQLFFLLIVSTGINLKIFFSGPTLFDAIYSTLIIVYSFWLLTKYDTNFLVLYFLTIFGFLFVTISITIIEGGAYMIEIFESGYPTGATARFVFYMQLFTIGCYLTYRKLRNSKLPFHHQEEFINDRTIVLLFNAFFITVLLILAVILMVYGTPLSTGLGRTKYWGEVAPPGTRYLNSLLPQLNFVNGIFLTQTIQKRSRRLLIGILLSALIIQFLQGEKFSGLFLSSYFFALPSLFQNYKSINLPVGLKLVFGAIALGLLALISIFVNYTLQFGDPLMGLFMIADRISLQGQVWWATDRLTSNSLEDISYFVNHLFGFGVGVKEKGLNYLMFLIAPPAVANAYFDSGSGFTAGFPSIILLGSGYLWGIPIILLCAMLMGVVLYLFSLAFTRKKILFSVIVLKLFFAAYLAFAMGDIHLLVSIKYLVFILFTVILFYVNIILFRSSNKSIKI